MDKIKIFFDKAVAFCKDTWQKVVEFAKPLIKKFIAWLKEVNWKVVWDHVTTGLLIFLMCSPIMILAYIFIWFITK